MTTNLENLVVMPYVEFMAFLKETNRAPGGEKMLIEMAKNVFLNSNSKFLHIACNTGSSTREISKLTNAKGYGIDINENMIRTAQELAKQEDMSEQIEFNNMDAQNLQYNNQEFDLVFSAGGVAFVPDKPRAISEMTRVCKDSWFVADVVMYYKNEVPQYIIDEMNALMNLNIQKRDLNYWISVYENEWLTLFHHHEWSYAVADHKKLLDYCKYMTHGREILPISEIEKQLAEYKLFWIMSLFAENHKYLWAALLIFRKKSINEQAALFSCN